MNTGPSENVAWSMRNATAASVRLPKKLFSDSEIVRNVKVPSCSSPL